MNESPDRIKGTPSELWSLPKSEAELLMWETSRIIRHMDKLQEGMFSGPFKDIPPEEQEKCFLILSAELDKRIANYQFPDEVVAATRDYFTHRGDETEEEVDAKWRKWNAASSKDYWLYNAAAMFRSAEMPQNSHQKAEILKNAYWFILSKLREEAGVPHKLYS